MPSLDVTKPGQVVTGNFSLFSLEQYPEILELCAFSWSYRVYLAFCRTASHNQRLATHHPQGTHYIGDVVTGRMGKHPQHFKCPWVSWRNLQEDVPTGSWAGFVVGVSKVVSQICDPLMISGPWLLWVPTSLTCSLPLLTTLLCWLSQDSRYGEGEKNGPLGQHPT